MSGTGAGRPQRKRKKPDYYGVSAKEQTQTKKGMRDFRLAVRDRRLCPHGSRNTIEHRGPTWAGVGNVRLFQVCDCKLGKDGKICRSVSEQDFAAMAAQFVDRNRDDILQQFHQFKEDYAEALVNPRDISIRTAVLPAVPTLTGSNSYRILDTKVTRERQAGVIFRTNSAPGGWNWETSTRRKQTAQIGAPQERRRGTPGQTGNIPGETENLEHQQWPGGTDQGAQLRDEMVSDREYLPGGVGGASPQTEAYDETQQEIIAPQMGVQSDITVMNNDDPRLLECQVESDQENMSGPGSGATMQDQTAGIAPQDDIIGDDIIRNDIMVESDQEGMSGPGNGATRQVQTAGIAPQDDITGDDIIRDDIMAYNGQVSPSDSPAPENLELENSPEPQDGEGPQGGRLELDLECQEVLDFLARTNPAPPPPKAGGTSGEIPCMNKPLTPSTPSLDIPIPSITQPGAFCYGEIPPQQRVCDKQGQELEFPLLLSENRQDRETASVGHSATATTEDTTTSTRLRNLNDIRNQFSAPSTPPAYIQTQNTPQQLGTLPHTAMGEAAPMAVPTGTWVDEKDMTTAELGSITVCWDRTHQRFTWSKRVQDGQGMKWEIIRECFIGEEAHPGTRQYLSTEAARKAKEARETAERAALTDAAAQREERIETSQITQLTAQVVTLLERDLRERTSQREMEAVRNDRRRMGMEFNRENDAQGTRGVFTQDQIAQTQLRDSMKNLTRWGSPNCISFDAWKDRVMSLMKNLGADEMYGVQANALKLTILNAIEPLKSRLVEDVSLQEQANRDMSVTQFMELLTRRFKPQVDTFSAERDFRGYKQLQGVSPMEYFMKKCVLYRQAYTNWSKERLTKFLHPFCAGLLNDALACKVNEQVILSSNPKIGSLDALRDLLETLVSIQKEHLNLGRVAGPNSARGIHGEASETEARKLNKAVFNKSKFSINQMEMEDREEQEEDCIFLHQLTGREVVDLQEDLDIEFQLNEVNAKFGKRRECYGCGSSDHFLRACPAPNAAARYKEGRGGKKNFSPRGKARGAMRGAGSGKTFPPRASPATEIKEINAETGEEHHGGEDF